jgi:uncharacterized damage-inducible protein DinB
MSETAQILNAGFDRVYRALRQRLADGSCDLAWRPGAGWNSYGVLVTHICHSNRRFLGVMVAGLPDVRVASHDEQFAEGAFDREALGRLVDETEALTRRAIDGVTDWNGGVTFRDQSLPRRDVALLALGHAFQHVGQMAVLDRLRKAAAA